MVARKRAPPVAGTMGRDALPRVRRGKERSWWATQLVQRKVKPFVFAGPGQGGQSPARRAEGTWHEGKRETVHALDRHPAAKGLAALPKRDAKERAFRCTRGAWSGSGRSVRRGRRGWGRRSSCRRDGGRPPRRSVPRIPACRKRVWQARTRRGRCAASVADARKRVPPRGDRNGASIRATLSPPMENDGLPHPAAARPADWCLAFPGGVG